jgi:hypothetical protein
MSGVKDQSAKYELDTILGGKSTLPLQIPLNPTWFCDKNTTRTKQQTVYANKVNIQIGDKLRSTQRYLM